MLLTNEENSYVASPYLLFYLRVYLYAIPFSGLSLDDVLVIVISYMIEVNKTYIYRQAHVEKYFVLLLDYLCEDIVVMMEMNSAYLQTKCLFCEA